VLCWGGVGRTGVIVGCWSARHGGQPALARLRELWKQCPKSQNRGSPETAAQEKYVAGWRETAGIPWALGNVHLLALIFLASAAVMNPRFPRAATPCAARSAVMRRLPSAQSKPS